METVENIYPPWDKTMKFAPEWIAKRDTLLYWTNSLPEYRIKEREQEKQWTWRKFLHFKFIKEFGHLNDIELKKKFNNEDYNKNADDYEVYENNKKQKLS